MSAVRVLIALKLSTLKALAKMSSGCEGRRCDMPRGGHLTLAKGHTRFRLRCLRLCCWLTAPAGVSSFRPSEPPFRPLEALLSLLIF